MDSEQLFAFVHLLSGIAAVVWMLAQRRRKGRPADAAQGERTGDLPTSTAAAWRATRFGIAGVEVGVALSVAAAWILWGQADPSWWTWSGYRSGGIEVTLNIAGAFVLAIGCAMALGGWRSSRAVAWLVLATVAPMIAAIAWRCIDDSTMGLSRATWHLHISPLDAAWAVPGWLVWAGVMELWDRRCVGEKAPSSLARG